MWKIKEKSMINHVFLFAITEDDCEIYMYRVMRADGFMDWKLIDALWMDHHPMTDTNTFIPEVDIIEDAVYDFYLKDYDNDSQKALNAAKTKVAELYAEQLKNS
jgi:hypothetical protein